MQTKETIAKLCPCCQVAMTTHTLEAKTTSGGSVSFPCCLACRPKVERNLRNARKEMLGEDNDEDDDVEAQMILYNTSKLDSIIADKHARPHQEVTGRERYVDAGTVSPKKKTVAVKKDSGGMIGAASVLAVLLAAGKAKA